MNETASSSKVILITGSSSGFGMLTAVRLSAKYHVIATMRNPDKKMELLKALAVQGTTLEILALDVTDPESIHAAIAGVLERYGHIDVVVNNAGYGIGGAFEDLTQEEIRKQMEVNFFGVQNVCREVIPIMRKQHSGKIINISSVAGFSTSPLFSAYNASKWALEGFSESISYELKLFGIDVLLIEPGTYNTKIFHENARYAKHFFDESSPYYPVSQFLAKKVSDYVNSCRKDPQDVARRIEKLIEAKNPNFRNIPDWEGKLLYTLRKILPFPIFKKLIYGILLAKFQNRI